MPRKFIPQRKNANKHTQRGLKELENSIQRDGWIGAITVTADGETFDGSARLETLANVMPDKEPIVIDVDGHTPVVVRRTDIPNADDPRAKRLAVAANRIAQVDLDWDASVLADLAQQEGDLLAGLFNDDELAELIGQGEAKEETADAGELVDKAAQLQEKWQVQRGDVWEIGKHRLMCGDSTSAEDVKTLMQGERARCGMHDPPYGIDWDTDYTRFTNGKKRTKVKYESIANDEKEFDPTHLLNFDQVVLWGANFYSKFLPVGSWLVWDKREQNGTAWLADAEIAWMKGGKGIYICPHRGPIRENRGSHPTQKRADVIAWCMDKAKFANDAIVFDAYCGSGTTLVACEQTGRIGRGMEIEPKYCAVTLERLSLLGLTPRRVES